MEIILCDDTENRDKWSRIIHHLISKSVTYGCDDSPSKEEGTAHVPVAGVVGCVSAGTNSSTHGIYGVLERQKRVSYQQQNPSHKRQNSRSCFQRRLSWWHRNKRTCPSGFGESERMSTPPANVYVELCTGVCYAIVQHSWENAWGRHNTQINAEGHASR